MNTKGLLLTLAIFISAFSFAQTPNNNLNNSTPQTTFGFQGPLTSNGYKVKYFQDTVTLNSQPYLKGIPNLLVAVGDTLYFRNKYATGWISLAAIGGSGVTFDSTYVYDSIGRVVKYLYSPDGSVVLTEDGDTILITTLNSLQYLDQIKYVENVELLDSMVTVVPNVIYSRSSGIDTIFTSTSFNLPHTQPLLKRIDVLYLKSDNTIDTLMGAEDSSFTFPRSVPTGGIYITFITVEDSTYAVYPVQTGVRPWVDGGNDTTAIGTMGQKQKKPLGFLTDNLLRAYISASGDFNLSPKAIGNNQESNALFFRATNNAGVSKDASIRANSSGDLTFASASKLFTWEGSLLRFWFQSAPHLFTTSTTAGFKFGNSSIQASGELFTLYNTSINGTTPKNKFLLRYDGIGVMGDSVLPADFENSALMNFKSTGKGVLLPRMTTTQRTGIASPANGLLVYDTDSSSLFQYASSAWQNLYNTGGGGGWSLTGNAGTNPATDFIGTTDNVPLYLRVNNDTIAKFGINSGNTSIGVLAEATGSAAIALGSSAIASGANSTALNGGIASGVGALAFGNNAVSSGIGSLSFSGGQATGDNSFSMGINTIASGDFSFVFGLDSKAMGSNSVAIGNNTEARGVLSLAIGEVNIASGDYSVALGGFNTSKSYGGTVIGYYNDTLDTPNSSAASPTNRIFQLGNGANGAPSNAMTILANGNVGIGTTTPTEKLHVVGDGTNTALFMNGSVGIGTTTPSVKLDVVDNSGFRVGETAGNDILSVNSSYLNYSKSGDAVLNFNGNLSNGWQFLTHTATVGVNPRLSILGGIDGTRVGIGTTTPTATLHVSSLDSNVLKLQGLINTVLSTDSSLVIGTDGKVKKAVKATGGGGITALTADVTASGTGSVAATLATVNSNVGTFGSATQVGTFTVNGKGLITAASNVTIASAGVSYVSRSTAPTDTTTFWLDTSSGFKRVWPLKQRIKNSWRVVQWYDPIANFFSVQRPLYVLGTGQSNMIYRTTGGDLSVDSRVVEYRSGAWTIADRVAGNANNIALQFAKQVAMKENRVVRFVVIAEASKPIEDWYAGAAKTLEISAAVSAAQIDSFDVILLRQGEQNAALGNTEPVYAAKVSQVFNAYRDSTWFGKSGRVVLGGLNEAYINTGVFNYYYHVNNGEKAGVDFVGVNMLGLSQAGGIHIDGASIDTVGLRYYEAYRGQAPQYSLEKTPNVSWLDDNELSITPYVPTKMPTIRLAYSASFGRRGGYLKMDSATSNLRLGWNPTNNSTSTADSGSVFVNSLNQVGVGQANNTLTSNASQLHIKTYLPVALSIGSAANNAAFQIDGFGRLIKPLISYNLYTKDGNIALHHQSGDVENGRIRFSRINVTSLLPSYNGAYIHYNGTTNLFHLGTHGSSDTTVANDVNVLSLNSNGVSIGTGIAPTAALHIKASPGTANNASIKINSGTLLPVAEAGTQEYNGNSYQTKASGLRYGLGGVIYDNYADVNNFGTTETDMFAFTTPANTLALDGSKINFNYTVNLTDVTATAQVKVYFGGTLIANTGILTVSATGAVIISGWMIRTSATTVRSSVNISSPTASTAVYTSQTDITGLTLSSTNILKITGQAGGAGGGSADIIGKMATVSWQPLSAL